MSMALEKCTKPHVASHAVPDPQSKRGPRGLAQPPLHLLSCDAQNCTPTPSGGGAWRLGRAFCSVRLTSVMMASQMTSSLRMR
jgi:hypothetical protein